MGSEKKRAIENEGEREEEKRREIECADNVRSLTKKRRESYNCRRYKEDLLR